MSWSDPEIKELREKYPYFTTKELIPMFQNHSKESINKKAQSINVTKHEGLRRAKSITDVEEIDLKSIDPKFANFMCGLIAAEGHFSRYYLEKRGLYRFAFTIELISKDKDILMKFNDLMSTGGVYNLTSKKSTEQPKARFDIASIGGLYKRLIPFVDKYGLKNSRKQRQYKEWRSYMNDYVPSDVISIRCDYAME